MALKSETNTPFSQEWLPHKILDETCKQANHWMYIFSWKKIEGIKVSTCKIIREGYKESVYIGIGMDRHEVINSLFIHQWHKTLQKQIIKKKRLREK